MLWSKSFWLGIYPAVLKLCSTHSKQEATLAYDNYKQDCLSRQRYGISYESYMDHVIDSLIEAQYDTEVNTHSSSDRLTLQSVKDIDNKVSAPQKVTD